ncbi:hypothetical protein HC928_08955 [bacterium]|nr:hypothetical protein [bacterium]
MKKFNVNDRVYPPRVINGVWIQVNGEGTVKEVSDDGYTVLFDWGATISGLQDDELELVARVQDQS